MGKSDYNPAIMSKGYSMTHVGHKRSTNQDSLLVDESLQLYAVADGMGGHKGGEIASALAVKSFHETIKNSYKNEDFSPEKYLEIGFNLANEAVFERSQENNQEFVGMGTTLVACMIWKNKAYFANVGDSRAYFFKNSYLWRITEDHSLINNQLKSGLVEKEQIPFLVHSNLITRSIGFLPNIQVDLFEREISGHEELFLLCSDGLNEISEEKISQLAQDYSPESLAKQCVQHVLDGEANDNVTVVVVTP